MKRWPGSAFFFFNTSLAYSCSLHLVGRVGKATGHFVFFGADHFFVFGDFIHAVYYHLFSVAGSISFLCPTPVKNI